MLREIPIATDRHVQFVDIRSLVERVLQEAGVQDGLCCIYSPHTTAAVTINEGADPDVVRDMIMELEKMVPWEDPQYRHAEGNSASHIKASLFGASAWLIIEKGRAVLGTWQTIYFCEFDGPRRRRVYVKVVGR